VSRLFWVAVIEHADGVIYSEHGCVVFWVKRLGSQIKEPALSGAFLLHYSIVEGSRARKGRRRHALFCIFLVYLFIDSYVHILFGPSLPTALFFYDGTNPVMMMEHSCPNNLLKAPSLSLFFFGGSTGI
jgi:hypothetical protein